MSAAIDEQAWIEPRPDFYIQSGCSLDNPFGIHPDEIMRLLLNEQPEITAQTVFGLYVPSSGLVFSSKLILNLFRDQLLERGSAYIDTGVRNAYVSTIKHYGVNQKRFKGGVDLARKKDKTVIYILDTLPLQQGTGKARVVYMRDVTRVPWEVIYSEIGYAGWLFGAEMKVDSTGAGDVVLSELQNRRYCPVHHVTNLGQTRCRDENDVPRFDCDPDAYWKINVSGYEFTTRSKVSLLTHLAQSLGYGYDEEHPEQPFGQVESPQFPELRVQLSGYHWDDKKLQTDHVMSLALAVWLGVKGTPGEAYVGAVYGKGA